MGLPRLIKFSEIGDSWTPIREEIDSLELVANIRVINPNFLFSHILFVWISVTLDNVCKPQFIAKSRNYVL